MAPEYSPEALGDLSAIWAYFASDRNEVVATRILRDIQAKIARLEKHPTLGIERPELGRSMRSVSLANHDYVVYYLLAGGKKGVQIARILHGRRDVTTVLAGAASLLLTAHAAIGKKRQRDRRNTRGRTGSSPVV
jgi:plasmid stabilization system protein ParE